MLIFVTEMRIYRRHYDRAFLVWKIENLNKTINK